MTAKEQLNKDFDRLVQWNCERKNIRQERLDFINFLFFGEKEEIVSKINYYRRKNGT